MRSATLLLVCCILISFIFSHVKEVEAGLSPMAASLRVRKDIFVGGCGSDGNKTCINDFVKKGGAANKPFSCECDNFGFEHLCRCNFT
ncbi:PREDICTED: putative defensin-like protein 235 [Camelina sativa]|uniref:Defensin-like protein 235 n=1 Tax=Camelina sativa TaxID=90675 RepID=A0ABM1QQ87_CAMSA|nr:PREDICTED: putative defensin-like protein 235 [Camelina sativa]